MKNFIFYLFNHVNRTIVIGYCCIKYVYNRGVAIDIGYTIPKGRFKVLLLLHKN